MQRTWYSGCCDVPLRSHPKMKGLFLLLLGVQPVDSPQLSALLGPCLYRRVSPVPHPRSRTLPREARIWWLVDVETGSFSRENFIVPSQLQSDLWGWLRLRQFQGDQLRWLAWAIDSSRDVDLSGLKPGKSPANWDKLVMQVEMALQLSFSLHQFHPLLFSSTCGNPKSTNGPLSAKLHPRVCFPGNPTCDGGEVWCESLSYEAFKTLKKQKLQDREKVCCRESRFSLVVGLKKADI